MARFDLSRLLRPRSVAVVGGRIAESVVEELDKLGFDGEVWPVNPKRGEMGGKRCFARLEDLPEPPDAAYLAIAREASVEAVKTLAELGAGGAVVHAAGFSEAGEQGEGLTTQLIENAGSMPILGPNCWGFLNLTSNVALWPDFHGAKSVERGVAIISQSGNIAINITMQQRAIPIACIVSLGNQTVVDVNELVEAFLEDDNITAIGLIIEGIPDTAEFSRLAIKAKEIGKPIIALKTGRSQKGVRAAVSHTAMLAGSDDLYDAMFERFAVPRLDNIPAFLETLKFLHVSGPLSRNRIATLSCSGGEAALGADRASLRSIALPEFSASETAAIKQTLSELVDVANPLDYHTFIWGDAEAMQATYAATMAADHDLSVLIFDYPRPDRSKTGDYDIALTAWIEATRQTGKKTAVAATLSECLPEHICETLHANGIVTLNGLEEAFDGIEAAAICARPVTGKALSTASAPSNDPQQLDDAEARKRILEQGVALPASHITSPENAATAASDIGFPVVMKATGLAHKTEQGGIILNITDEHEAKNAANDLASLSDEIIVEEMVTDGICELIIGVARDHQFGPYLVIGSGGILVELLGDRQVVLLPATMSDIEHALQNLKCAKLLAGYRGRPGADMAKLIETIAAIARFAEDNLETISELDINPLIVRPQPHPPVAADILICMGDQST